MFQVRCVDKILQDLKRSQQTESSFCSETRLFPVVCPKGLMFLQDCSEHLEIKVIESIT